MVSRSIHAMIVAASIAKQRRNYFALNENSCVHILRLAVGCLHQHGVIVMQHSLVCFRHKVKGPKGGEKIVHVTEVLGKVIKKKGGAPYQGAVEQFWRGHGVKTSQNRTLF
jgi:hypothetical protein